MRRHLVVVSEKKIKMLKTSFPPHRVLKYYRWHHNIFLRTTYIHNKYMYTPRAYIFNTVGVMLRTDDAGPSAPYYKLTGELKTVPTMKLSDQRHEKL